MPIIAAKDINSLVLLAGIALAVITFIGVLISFIVANHKFNLFNRKMGELSDSIRVFRLDIKNDSTVYYDTKSLRKRQTSNLMAFYNKFPYSEREKIISWIGRLLENDPEVEKTLEVTIILSNAKKKYFTLLEVTKIDLDNQIIHLESHMLRSLAPSHSHREVEGYYKYSSETAITQQIRDHKKRGFMIVMKFFQKHNNDPIDKVDYMTIKNSLAPMISPTRSMMECGADEIAIIDFKVFNRSQTVQLLRQLEALARRRLAVKKTNDTIVFTSAILENKLIPMNMDNTLEIANKLIEHARDEEAKYIFFEDTGLDTIQSTETNYRTEVERIIRDKRLEYFFMPVYDTQHKRIIGYRTIVKPLDSFFSTIDELKNYAFKTDDDRELFTTIAKNSISRFIQQKNDANYKLFFDVEYNEIRFIFRTLSQIKDIKKASIVVCLDEQDFADLPEMSVDAVVGEVTSLKTNGYQVALKVNDNSELPLHPSIYESCDFLIVIASSPIPQKGTRDLPIFHNLLENLLKYHKTTISFDMPSWDVTELVVRLGVPIVSSEVISPPDENVLPLSKKTILKLDKLT